jgi:peptidoglycan/xylan/chitin deacetylase (PgdA/CDA1 family)
MAEPRDLIGYGSHPPQFEWPDGSRLAVSVVVSIEEGAERNPLDGDEVIEPLAEWAYPMAPGQRDLTVESEYEYGSRVGVWRVLELFDQYEIRPTVFGCALALERNPQIANAIRERNYDVVSHGYRWVSHLGLSEQQEHASVRQTLDSLVKTTGASVIGWHNRSPLPPTTRAVLAEEGLLFDCHSLSDDLPYFVSVHGRPFLVVPYAPDTNDIRFWRNGLFLASDFATYCIDSLDGFLKLSRRLPRMMSVGLHPRIIGRPGRLSGLEAFLERLASTPDVWIASRNEIAKFWASEFAPEGTWNWPLDSERAGPRQA